MELMARVSLNLPDDLRELRVRADAGFGFDPALEMLGNRATQYAVWPD